MTGSDRNGGSTLTGSSAMSATHTKSPTEDGDDKDDRGGPAAAPAPVPNRSISWAHHPIFAEKARGIRTRALRFTSSWFSVTMGTGIVNILLFDLPWKATHAAFRGIGCAFLVGDIILFAAFTFLTILRYYLSPRIFMVMLHHETHSLFLGTIPMGLITIVSGIALTGEEYGLKTLDAALVLYWITVALSCLTAFGVPFVMFTQHKHATETMTAAWLLPIVPLITAASVGSTMCKLLLEQDRLHYCMTVLIGSYLCAGIGMLLAAAIIVLYLQRLVLHHLPPREVVVSSWLPVGPIGQGGYALIELVTVPRPDRPPPMLGSAVLTGLLLWGLGIWFAFLAIVSIAAQFRDNRVEASKGAAGGGSQKSNGAKGAKGTKGAKAGAEAEANGGGVREEAKKEGAKTTIFNMGWFPLGSLTLLTFSLAKIFDSIFFKVCATIMTAAVTLLWFIVFIPTCIGFFRGTLFAAPCLQALPREYVEKLAPAEGGAPLRKTERQAQAGA
ncbi:Plasma membrane sulfite pump involved in sulfite metabolism [Rhodotorula sphaerocarpa]